jgi:hypothetical protein
MYPHRIRLRGPWEAEPLDPPGTVRRIDMPARLGDCGLGGCRRVLLRRRFGRPRQLDEHERVWLVGEGLSGTAEIRLNDDPIGTCSGGPFAIAVNAHIADRNVLDIDLVVAGADDGLCGDVAVEIRCRAYLSTVNAEREADGRLRVSGEICGEAEGRLDVYVLADGKTMAYRKCAAGERFALVTDDAVAADRIRVELVAGPVIWYAAEIEAP